MIAKYLIPLLSLGMLAAVGEMLAGETNSATTKPTQAKVSAMVQVRLIDQNGKPGEITSVAKVVKTDEEWRKQLSPEQYRIARGKGTEPAFCGLFYDQKRPGVYHCVCCDLPLFTSESKYHSGTGWPSFFSPVAKENVTTKVDLSHGMRRTEILCARCDAHLGHVFEDGPKPTGLRYCLNSASLRFVENAQLKESAAH